jgi:hypothetical protein
MPTLIAGRYEVLEELERRVAGTAYKVRHPLLDSVLAVTVLSEEFTADAGRLAHLQRAVRAALRLRHDHIVPVLDFGRDDGRYYLVEVLPGGKRLDAGGSLPLPPADALRVARQLTEALAHAHDHGVVHGAITAASVFVEPGTPLRAVLSGFVLEATAHAACVPEAATTIDVRGDVSALGLLLYEMLEGRPFLSGTAARPDDASAPPLPTFSRILPSGVSALVARAIRRTQQSMTQLRDEIDGCLRRIGERNSGDGGRRATVVAQIVPRAPVRAAARSVTDASSAQRAVVRIPFPADDDGAVESTAAQSAVARRLLGSHGVRVGSPRLSVKGSALAAAVVLLAGGWLALRTARVAPAASVSTAALVYDEVPTREPAVAAPVRSEMGAVSSDLPADADVGETPLPPSGESLVLGPPPPARRPPRIVTSHPGPGAVDVLEGAIVDFDVRATNGVDEGMTYAWFLDERQVGRRPRWRFSAPYGTAGAAHTVEVQVADATGAMGPRVAWSVEVLPRMSNANVLDWVGRLTAALERKDVATLRLYGLVTDDAAGEALAKRVSRQKTARVSVANESIELDGRYARVTLDLAEFDERGTLLATWGESYDLEKHPTGFVALRTR